MIWLTNTSTIGSKRWSNKPTQRKITTHDDRQHRPPIIADQIAPKDYLAEIGNTDRRSPVTDRDAASLRR
jgi:hypothetical protein